MNIDRIMLDISEASSEEQREFHKRYMAWRKFATFTTGLVAQMDRDIRRGKKANKETEA